MSSEHLTGYEALAMPHMPGLLAFARRRLRADAEADELVQETLLRGWTQFSALRDLGAMRGWLFRILSNLVIEHHRSHRRRAELLPITRLEQSHDDLLASNDPGPLEYFVSQQSSAAIRQALAALPEIFAVAVELRDLEGFRYEEISDIVEVPVGTVMSRIARGRRLLAGLLWEWSRAADNQAGDGRSAREDHHG